MPSGEAEVNGPNVVGSRNLAADRPSVDSERPLVVGLGDAVAQDVALTGGKAAALARGGVAGLDILPGTVLSTAFCDAVDAGAELADHPAVTEALERAGGDRQALVARSSSVVEDMAASSMAGQFESIIGIWGVIEFRAAVAAVLDSRERAGATDHPIAVLVQPLIEPAFGGVMFGVDPGVGPQRSPGWSPRCVAVRSRW